MDMAPVDDRWRLIEVAGYWVFFRFADAVDLKRGEGRGLRYVGAIEAKQT